MTISKKPPPLIYPDATKEGEREREREKDHPKKIGSMVTLKCDVRVLRNEGREVEVDVEEASSENSAATILTSLLKRSKRQCETENYGTLHFNTC